MQDTCCINVISSSSFNAKHFYISAFFLVLIKQQCNQPQLLLSILFCVISDQCGLHCRLYSQLWMKPHFWHLFICDPWSMFIFRPFLPSSLWNDISYSSYISFIYCWKKLNYCDFIAAPAPKWFLVISHHFSCSAEVISWNSECFLLFLTAWHQTKLCWS